MLRLLSNIRIPAFIGIASLVALCGCHPVQYRLGQTPHLDRVPLVSIDAHLLTAPRIAPGERIPLVVRLTAPDGSAVGTDLRGRNTAPWNDIAVTSTVVSVDKYGRVSLPQDPIVSDGKTGHIVVTIPSHPSLRSEFDVAVRYDYAFSAYFSGTNGSSGQNGSDGSDGLRGTDGSIDPQHPSSGGNGSNGTDGSNGSDGGRGEDGPSVQVRLALRPGNRPLLQAGVSAGGYGERFYLVDPSGGSLTIRSAGGSGGSGGSGGRGGRGGAGGTGSPNGQNGSDGHDGMSGQNGSSGSDGSITITYDPEVKPYLSTIHATNAVFKEQPVPPLW